MRKIGFTLVFLSGILLALSAVGQDFGDWGDMERGMGRGMGRGMHRGGPGGRHHPRDGRGPRHFGPPPEMKVDSAFAALFESGVFTHEGVELPYRVSATGEAGADAPVLVVFLHGHSASGNDNMRQLAKKGLKDLRDCLAEGGVPAYVLAPQCPMERRWSERESDGQQMTAVVKALIDDFVQSHGISPGRVYLFGESMGGQGVWRMLTDYPDYFAAAMAVASRPRHVDASRVARTPLCCVVGTADDMASPEAVMPIVTELQNHGAEVKFKALTGKTHPQTCHDAFTLANIAWVLGHERR